MDVADLFFFPNQKLLPHTWQSICFTSFHGLTKIFLNGLMIFNETIPLKENDVALTSVYLAGNPSEKTVSSRFIGTASDLYIWNRSLGINDLKEITSLVFFNSLLLDEALSISASKPQQVKQCIDHQSVSTDSEIFEDISQRKLLLVEVETTLEDSNFLCKSFGGELFVPLNDQDLVNISSLLSKSKVCPKSWIGLKKSNDKLYDLDNYHVPFERWNLNEPNGKDYEQCVILRNGHYFDTHCLEKQCFTCKMPAKKIYTLRGNIPFGLDRDYFISMDGQKTEIIGTKGTRCSWNSTWNFGSNLEMDQPLSNLPPLGLRGWNNGLMLKFTQCHKDKFTCHTYGYCVSMTKRCDGEKDCQDGSMKKIAQS